MCDGGPPTGPAQAWTARGRMDNCHQPNNLEEVMRCKERSKKWKGQLGRNGRERTQRDAEGTTVAIEYM